MKIKFMNGKLGKWIKRIVIILIILGLVAFGAYKLFFNKSHNVEQSAQETLENLDSYYMEATMDFYKGEETRSYNLKVSYEKDETDMFKVSMFDKECEQEQIIIKNNVGVYVLTPALNQVYKFDGDWPLNGYKPYLYQSMVDTIKGTSDISKLEDGYLIVSTPNFENMPSWARQEMKMTKEYKPVWVHIYDNNNDVAVKISFVKVEFNPSFSDDYFVVENNMIAARENLSESTSSTVYDLPYYPVNSDVDSSLKEVSNIVVEGETSVVLTYSGNDNFTIIESLAESYEQLTEIVVNGTIVDIYGVIGYYVSNNNINKLYFTHNGVSYQIWSDSEDVSTLIEVASGMELADEVK